MNCHYCNKPCLNIGEDHRRCLDCRTDYRRNIINIHCLLNGKNYYVQFRNGHYDYPCRIIRGSYNGWDENILVNLTTQPDITPSNVKEKLSLILLFS